MTGTKKKPRKRKLVDRLCAQRDRALYRVVKIWSEDDLEELDKALDVLTVAHIKATFEYASCSFSS